MTKKSDVHKCQQCGCLVAIITGGEGSLTCCGQSMDKVTPDNAKKLIHSMSRPGSP